MIQKAGIPLKQLHSYDYSGPYAGFRGAVNFYREIDRMVNSKLFSFVKAPWQESPELAGSYAWNMYRRGDSHATKTYTGRIGGTDRPDREPGKDVPARGRHVRGPGHSRCLPHSHGSQGCCAYHRSALTQAL